MKTFRPFRIVHPPADKAHLVATRSYLTYDAEELHDKLTRNPFSYLHVINPDGMAAERTERGTVSYFELVRSAYEEWRERDWLVATEAPTYAVYRQTIGATAITGIVALMDLAAYGDRRLRLHEQTLEVRETLFATFLDTVGFNAEPVLMARPEGHPGQSELDALVDGLTAQRPDFDFTTADAIRHTAWWVDAGAAEEWTDRMNAIPSLYLADGHHRSASSHRVAADHPDDPGRQGLLSFVIPESELIILGYHREVRNLPEAPAAWLPRLAALPDVASVMPCEPSEDLPLTTGAFRIHHGTGSWRVELVAGNAGRIDGGWLGEHVLSGFWGIDDPRSDNRLRYIPGAEARSEWWPRVTQHPDRCVFELAPVSSEQLKFISDAGGTFPPKSTWIEPKLRSGLFIYQFDEHG